MARSSYLIPTAEQPRVRRAADATGVVIGVVLFLWAWRSFSNVENVLQASEQLLRRVPDWLFGTLGVLYTLALAYVLALFLAVLVQWRHRRDAARDMVLAALTSLILGTLLVRLITQSWPRVLIELGRADAIPQLPILRVTFVTAALLVVAPHLTRPMRRVGWLVIFIVAVSGVGIGLGLPSSSIGGVGLGAAAAGLVLLTFGSPRGYPNTESIADALRGLGVEVFSLRLDDDQSWGVRRLVGESVSHGRIEIKAYGRDATDSQFFSRLWRYIWYRETEPFFALTRMQAAEHEALVAMMAERTGASVSRILTVGRGGDDIAVLAVDTNGVRMTSVEPEEISDESLAAVWASVGALHAGGISHGSLRGASVMVDGDRHQITDFGSGAIATSTSAAALDVVELLVSTARMVGVSRAVASALVALGNDRLVEVLPYIQVPAVSREERQLVGKPKALVDAVREEVVERTGADVEEAAQIRRVEARSLVMTAVTLLAAYFLISQLSGIDFQAVWGRLQEASWIGIIVAFVVGQFVYLPEATAMLAAVGQPIPLRPAMVLQSATRFISLAVPSSAGRIAMTAAFLRKYGFSFTASVLQGSIDTISGLIVEVSILILAFVSGSLDLGLDAGEREWGPILIVLVVVIVVAAVVVRRVKRLRDWVMPVLGEALGTFRDVLKDPRRTLTLLFSNFAARFVLAISMWVILLSLDVSLGIWSVLTATVATGLLGGVVPIPGGVGVSEAVLTAFLVIFGVDEITAFSAAVIYRLATFYIPSVAGYFSTRWLERNGYV